MGNAHCWLPLGLLPALCEFLHQKVPSSERKPTYPVGWSVALLAPRVPKCPFSARGSMRPGSLCTSTEVLVLIGNYFPAILKSSPHRRLVKSYWTRIWTLHYPYRRGTATRVAANELCVESGPHRYHRHRRPVRVPNRCVEQVTVSQDVRSPQPPGDSGVLVNRQGPRASPQGCEDPRVAPRMSGT